MIDTGFVLLGIDLDDGSSEECNQSVPKATAEHLFEEYYRKLVLDLESASTDTTTEPITELSDEKKELLEQLSKLSKEIENYKRKGTEHYLRFGLAIAKLKRMYFKLCSICIENNPDVYSVLSCRRCTKASHGNTFFNDLKSDTNLGSYSKGYLNFLITFAGLCKEYPKFQQTKWDVKGLKKYIFSYLPIQLEKDKHIWI